jgi:tetratricopeptide (TPR) repeat protein
MEARIYIKYLFVFFAAFLFCNSVKAQSSYAKKIDSLKSIAEQDISQDSLASVYSVIGILYYKSDSLIPAIIYKKKAAAIYLENNNLDKYTAHLETIGILYSFINDYKQSLKYFLDAIKILDEQNKKDEHYYSLIQNIGITYVEAEESQKGIPFLINSLKFFETDSLSSKEYLVVNYVDLGVAYKGEDMIDSAFYYYHKALSAAKLFNIDKHTGGILINLGDLYKGLKVYEKSKSFYLEAISEFRRLSDERGYWHAVYGLSDVEKSLNNPSVAIDSINKAIEYFLVSDDFSYLRESYQLLSNIYEEQNDITNAFKYFKLCSAMKDSIVINDQKSRMTELQMQYELQKTEIENKNEISLLQKENQLKIYKVYIVIGLLLIGLLTIILYVFRLRSRKKLTESYLENVKLEQKQMEMNLNYKQKEMENLALYIIQKNEFLEQIKSDVGTLRKSSELESHSKIKSISLKITQSLRKNKDLEKLQDRIDQVHAIFLKNLSTKYPDLTEKEKRLCALLKLNFSSKEIASLNNISENAVMMARYRLRKKMNVSTDENLVEFLQKLT